jgi:hypothetical protein
MMQLAPAARVDAQVVAAVLRKLVGLVPVKEMVVMLRTAVPVFLSVTGTAVLCDPTLHFPKEMLAGVSVTVVPGARPVPVRATSCGVPVALSAMARLAA